MQDDPRIEIAAARAHGQAAERTEAHRGLDAPTLAYRRHGRAVSKMGHDHRGVRGAAAVPAAQFVDDVLIGQAVKTVAANPFVFEASRESGQPRESR